MSTSAILPLDSTYSVDFTSPSATTGQLSVFNDVLGQLQQAISVGDLTTAQTLYNALSALSPSSVTDSNVQGTFLTSIGTALNDGSVSEAQSALATYQSAIASTPSTASTSAATSTASSTTIAAGLIQSQIQLNLVSTLLGPSAGPGGGTGSTLSSSDANSLTSILNAAYGTSGSTNSTSSPTSTGTASTGTASIGTASTGTSTGSNSVSAGATPYDTLVASIQASLAAGDGTITPALAYLQASGNFINSVA